MSFWKKNPPSAKAKPPVIRYEKVPVKKTAVTTSTTRSSRTSTPTRQISNRLSSNLVVRNNAPATGDTYSTTLSPKKHAVSRKRSPVYQRIESDSSDDESDDASIFNKRQRLSSHESLEDPDRSLRARKPFSQSDSKVLVHAADIAAVKLGFKPCFGKADDVSVSLRYPGSTIRERYDLVYRNDCFDPVEEIIGVFKEVGGFFAPLEAVDKFLNTDNGFIRKLERARNLKSMEEFRSALDAYNAVVEAMSKDDKSKALLDIKHSLPESLVVRIMTQTYDRAVSPKVDLLRKYDNGTNEVYGELKSNLVYKILVETGLTSKQVFVDLGSGVANVVLQAALQVGCESWGCEIMDNACSLADAQKAEFGARCRLWGIQPGPAKLRRGDFMVNEDIRGALQRADVVLVNNEVFTPELNVCLVNLFLDLKEGCKIVSLKSFVPPNRKITKYNNNDPSNILEVEKKTYSTKSVSWKDEGGDYYIATKNSKRLQGSGGST